MEFRLLVVDDEPVVTETLSEIFGDEGYQVIQASSGDIAIKTLEKEQVDLVVLDLHMPGVPGEELLKYMRTRVPKVRSVVITGYPDREAAVKSIGCDGFLLKPLVMGELVEMVGSLLKEKDEYDMREAVMADEVEKAAPGEPMARLLLFEPMPSMVRTVGLFFLDRTKAKGVYTVGRASDVNEALAAFVGFHPDIVLMSLVGIPNAAEAVRAMLERKEHQPKDYIFYTYPRDPEQKAGLDQLPGTRWEGNPYREGELEKLAELVRRTALKYGLVKR